MTTWKPGDLFSQLTEPVIPVRRAAVEVSADCVTGLPLEATEAEWEGRLESLQQWICELLIKNQQLRMALLEFKDREAREVEDREAREIRAVMNSEADGGRALMAELTGSARDRNLAAPASPRFTAAQQ